MRRPLRGLVLALALVGCGARTELQTSGTGATSGVGGSSSASTGAGGSINVEECPGEQAPLSPGQSRVRVLGEVDSSEGFTMPTGAVDGCGSLYVIAQNDAQDPASVGGIPAPAETTFLARFDESTQAVWLEVLVDAPDLNRVSSELVVSPSPDTILVAGQTGPQKTELLNDTVAVPANSLFFLRLDRAGNLLQTKTFRFDACDLDALVATPEGEVMLTGDCDGAATVDFGNGVTVHGSPNTPLVFVARLDSDLEPRWAQQFDHATPGLGGLWLQLDLAGLAHVAFSAPLGELLPIPGGDPKTHGVALSLEPAGNFTIEDQFAGGDLDVYASASDGAGRLVTLGDGLGTIDGQHLKKIRHFAASRSHGEPSWLDILSRDNGFDNPLFVGADLFVSG
jgi:hypothetical protein